VISTLLGMWTCGLLLSAIIVQQEKVDWTYWRFTALVLLVAAVAMTAFACFAEPTVVGGRPLLIAAGGLVVLGAAIQLGVLLRTAGKPLPSLSGRIGPCLGLAAGLFVTYGFAAGTGILQASRAGWAEAAVGLSAAVVGLGTMAAMLGHAYLTAKAMPIDPLRRLVGAYGIAVGLQVVVGSIICWKYLAPLMSARPVGIDPFWTAVAVMYGLVGVAASVLFAIMAWQSVNVRNTQSTTGIMYFAMVMNFIGSLALCFLLRGEGPYA
jgi:uncharacterized membrane protein